MVDVTDPIQVRGAVIPADEPSWRFSRSSGPGGQSVNTSDSRVELSFDTPRVPGIFLNHYAVLRARATIEPSDDGAWDLLNRLTKIYLAPDAQFPAPKGPGYIVRYSVERIGGVGPWAPGH